ncbi:hypothetical protein NPIL_74331 [Nephila pilipes]|uniref:Uncharacterized protein n=1 Tax=Nephila pilipes TaxID=299642 RepID=A0A8X6U5P8_NEPPI|nr:hypothetical protein NPIL_74331 [Nephila pilipes]
MPHDCKQSEVEMRKIWFYYGKGRVNTNRFQRETATSAAREMGSTPLGGKVMMLSFIHKQDIYVWKICPVIRFELFIRSAVTPFLCCCRD